ncbi:hypothetical protein PY365_05930 [Roseiarcaceae bacterium H3SJ34-1]|uniref:hypothetical protein n=1 Tax=Terripilifer ovatus TaxID=3032367 RepID=UPI003AB95991|nr:hypothetical protein [Roseiarcaceae bacterium H3SJ34-1]
MQLAALIVEAAIWYGSAGLVVATVFLIFGIGRIDPAARGAYAFRPLLIPGVVLLWPYVLIRWAARERVRSGER